MVYEIVPTYPTARPMQAQAMQSVVPAPVIPAQAPVDTSADFMEKKDYGADMFKQYAMNNVTTEDIDQQLTDLTNKKADAYVELQKFYKSKGVTVDPKRVLQESDALSNHLDMQAKLLTKEKQTRLQTAEQTAQVEYQSLSSDFLDAKRKQQGLEAQIQQESTKPVTDPKVIQDLMNQKQQADNEVTNVERQFAKRGVKEPSAIIRQGDIMEKEMKDLYARGATKEEVQSILATKYPQNTLQIAEMTVGGGNKTDINQLLYKTALGQYDDEQGQFNAKQFLADTQKVPEYQGLAPVEISTKLIEAEDDVNSLSDLVFLGTQMHTDIPSIVAKLKEKGLKEEEIAKIMVDSQLNNVDPSKVLNPLNNILQSLKDSGMSKSVVQTVLDNYGLSMGWTNWNAK